jgi:hypothetical protein
MPPQVQTVTLGDFEGKAPSVDTDADNEVFSSDTLRRPGALKDFLWTEREQQHAARRRAILKAHPEVPPTACSLRRATPANRRPARARSRRCMATTTLRWFT